MLHRLREALEREGKASDIDVERANTFRAALYALDEAPDAIRAQVDRLPTAPDDAQAGGAKPAERATAARQSGYAHRKAGKKVQALELSGTDRRCRRACSVYRHASTGSSITSRTAIDTTATVRWALVRRPKTEAERGAR